MAIKGVIDSQAGTAATGAGQLAGNKIGGALAGAGVSGGLAGAIGGAAGKAVQGGVLSAVSALNALLFGSGRTDPDVQFCFWLEFDSIQWAKFTEANGIEWTVKTESFSEGGNNMSQVNLLGPASFKPLVLKKGFYAGHAGFYNMMRDQLESPMGTMRNNISLVVTNEKGDEIGRYDFKGAFVSRYKGPSFNAKQSDLAFEEIEITYDWFVFHPGDALSGLLDSLLGAAIKKGLSMLGS